MRSSILAIAILAAPVCAAGAQEIEVPEGLWSYQAQAMIGPLPVSDSGNECITPEKANWSLDGLVKEMNANCAITSQSAIVSGYNFTAACSEGPVGELQGSLVVGDDSAELTANGWSGGAEADRVPVSINASASRADASC